VGRKLAYPHHHQTRSRGLDEAPTELVVTNEEEDSDKASGSWAVSIPRYDNHKVGPMSRDMASVSRSLGRSRMMVFVNSGAHTFL
jgi:hypothetical protein